MLKRYTFETAHGNGEVRNKDGKVIAKVAYNLRTKHVFFEDGTPGLDSTTGSLRVLEGEKNLVDKGALVLDMKNGKEATFIVTRWELPSGINQIVISGAFRASKGDWTEPLDSMCYNYSMTGIEIRGVRRALGLRQEDFAAKLGVHQTTVARWETDKIEPSPEAIERIKKLGGSKTK